LDRTGSPLVRAAAILLATTAVSGIAFAYSNQIQNNLLKSRDLLLDQRNSLNRAYTDTGNKIAELQRLQNTIRNYLQDNDRSLRDVDYALHSNPK
jgi:uncharacterized protein HemX